MYNQELEQWDLIELLATIFLFLFKSLTLCLSVRVHPRQCLRFPAPTGAWNASRA